MAEADRIHAEPTTGAVALLVEDPDLAAGVPPEELALAERAVVVPAVDLPRGPCDVGELSPDPGLGLLVLDGVMTVGVVLGDRTSCAFAGPGDVLQSSTPADPLLRVAMAYHASSPVRLAALDRTFIAAVRRWPGLLLSLHARLGAQERRLAIDGAIGRLRRVEDRVLAVLWHLAERWGRVGGDGVVLPLSLTHETIGRLAGAERPTVSLALAALTRNGDVRRRSDGAYLLAPSALSRFEPGGGHEPQVRPLAVAHASTELADATPERAPAGVDAAALRRRFDTLRDELSGLTKEVDVLLAATGSNAERSTRIGRRVAEERAHRRG